MDCETHIETNNNILAGKPIIRGTRLSVEYIIGLMSSGWTEQQILENYPRISKEKLRAILDSTNRTVEQ